MCRLEINRKNFFAVVNLGLLFGNLFYFDR